MNHQPHRRQRLRGQALVEFALVMTLFMFLLVAVFEFGHLALAYTLVAAGVREAGRYGAASGLSENGVPRYADCEGIRAAALRLGALGGMTADDVSIEYDHGPGTAVFATCPPPALTLGDRIRVRATVEVHPWVLDLGTLTFQSQVERTVLEAIPLDAGGQSPPVPSPSPSPEPSPPPGEQGGETNEASFQVTPINPTAAAEPVGNSGKCKNIQFSWDANPDWPVAPLTYRARHTVGGVQAPLLSLDAPPYAPDTTLNNGTTITFEVWAVFVNGLTSGTLEATYQCQDGTLVPLR